MIDIHGCATRENCFGMAEYAGDYDPDYVDDPTAEEMANEAKEVPTVCAFCRRKLDERGAHLTFTSLRFCLRNGGR